MIIKDEISINNHWKNSLNVSNNIYVHDWKSIRLWFQFEQVLIFNLSCRAITANNNMCWFNKMLIKSIMKTQELDNMVMQYLFQLHVIRSFWCQLLSQFPEWGLYLSKKYCSIVRKVLGSNHSILYKKGLQKCIYEKWE